MIWIILFISLLIVGIVSTVIGYNDVFKNASANESFEGFGVVLTSFSALPLAASLLIIVIIHGTAETQINKANIEYSGLEAQLNYICENPGSPSAAEVMDRVAKWNQKVYSNKHYSKSKWTNWFYNKDYVDSLHYLEYGGIKHDE